MSSAPEQWLTDAAVVCVLDHLSVLEVGGDDHREWLQGQVTNDVAALQKNEARYTFVVNLKGRIVADAWVLDRGDAFWLVVDAAAVDTLIERLDRYIIMEDVELERRDECVVSVQGPKANDIAPEGWPIDRLGTGGRELLVAPNDVSATTAEAATRGEAHGGGAIDTATWERLRIARAVPRFGVDFGDWTYPQETGLTDLAVSFEKGCYVGQEPVVMLQHRGKAPKRLTQVRRADGGLALALLKRDAATVGAPAEVDGAPATVLRVIGKTPT